MKNQVQLIAYADRFGGDLDRLRQLLRSSFGPAVGGVHVLPFYTPFDGADAGFDPVDHTQVDPRLGTWESLAELSRDYEVMTDVIVNHMSSDSPQFKDYIDKGEESEFADLFLTMSDVFPSGASEEELTAIYRPRPGLPFTPYKLGGQQRLVWTTFTAQQVDIDSQSEAGREYLDSILTRLQEAGVKTIRLDAVGYCIKSRGTTCFMTPETMIYIGELTEQARAKGLEVIVEIHSYYVKQIEIASQVDWVYDFALPPLLLHSLFTGDGSALMKWIDIRPTNAITVLDTHDGIGVIDVGPDPDDPSAAGLLEPDQIDNLVNQIHANSNAESAQATGAAASNLDLYQVNCTYYSALGRDDDNYLLARAIQFFVPGIPQVYYVGALAGGNDMELLARSGVGRDINRHYYTDEEVVADLERPVVQALIALMRLRSTHPAFAGEFTAEAEGPSRLQLTWESAGASAILEADLVSADGQLTWRVGGETKTSSLRDLRVDQL